MTMNGGVKVATALLTGYVLGRTRRGKLVLGASIAAVAAQRGLQSGKIGKIPLLSGPAGLAARQAAKRVRATAGSALTARADKLSDALHERTTILRDGDRGRPDGHREEGDEQRKGVRQQRPEGQDRSEAAGQQRPDPDENEHRSEGARQQSPDEDEPQAPERPSRAVRDAGRVARRPLRRAPRR